MQIRKHPIISLAASALLALALCGLLVTASFAKGKSYRPNGGKSSPPSTASSSSSSSKSSSTPSKPSSSGGSSYRPSSGSSNQQGSSAVSSHYRPSQRSPGPAPTRTPTRPPTRIDSSTTVRTGTYNPSGTTYKPTPRVDTSSRDLDRRRDDARRGDDARRESNRTYYPGSLYRPSGSSRQPESVRVHPNHVYRPNPAPSYRPPKDYKPANYRGGYYHYPSRPHYRPYHYGHWTFDYYPGFSRRSAYFYFGYFPYIEIVRIVERPYTEVRYVETPIYRSGDYYRENPRYAALDEALSDIRSAWVSGRFDLIERHVAKYDAVDVFLDGRYDYTIEAEDYLQMTHDAVEELQTVSFLWDSVRERSDSNVTAFATHRFRDASGVMKLVYVSYTLEAVGRDYYITEVGSSPAPLH